MFTLTFPRYPSAREIMEMPVNFKVITLEAIELWKRANTKEFRTSSTERKLELLTELIQSLVKGYEKPVQVVIGRHYQYNPMSKTITLDHKHASIISALHELGHHLHGHSELEACRWSVWLFKAAFPATFETLEFRGHLLVKKTS